MVCADSNAAVDNLLAGLVHAKIQVVRVGRPEAIRKDLDKYSLQNTAILLNRSESCLLNESDVVCATNVGAAKALLTKIKFETVVMDEAAQATEGVSLIPIVRESVCSVVLVGDHKQLPPTVKSDLASKEGLIVSLFERLLKVDVQSYLLDTQYSMHPVSPNFLPCFVTMASSRQASMRMSDHHPMALLGSQRTSPLSSAMLRALSK